MGKGAKLLGERDLRTQGPGSTAVRFQLAVVVLTTGFLGISAYRDPGQFMDPTLLFWTVAVGLVDLMPVPAWGQLRLSLSFPILLAVAMIYNPPVAGVVALVGSFDSREFNRSITVVKALFVRSQIAASVLTASAVYHLFATTSSGWYVVVAAALLAVASDYCVNAFLVSAYHALTYRISLARALSRLYLGRRAEFLLSYLTLGLFAGVIAHVYLRIGPWVLPLFLAPLLFGRQMFHRTRVLELTTEKLREQERSLRAVSHELKRVSDAKSDFLASMSHELRTPLNAIFIAAQMLRDPIFGPLSEERVRDLSGKILSSGQHLLMLIEDLMDLSKIEAGRLDLQPRAVPVGMLVEEAERTISPIAIDKGVSLQVPSASDELVLADPLRIRQVLVNLLNNAVEFTEPGGRVWVQVTSSPSGVLISVNDSGIGIKPGDLERIFEPFEQVSDRPTAGAGLGLTIAKRIAELHGGRLEASSTPGAGSTFRLTLPKAGADLATGYGPNAVKETEATLRL